MLNRAIKLVLAISCLLLFSCAKPSSVGESSPTWIDKPYEVVSEKTFFAAVGEADDLNTASDRALSNIGKRFEVKIDTRSSDFTQISQFSSNSKGENSKGNSRQTRIAGVNRFVGATSEQILEGVSIKESWKSETGRHYALATLEKQLAAKLLLVERDNALKKASAHMEAAQQGEHIVAKMSNLKLAKETLFKLEKIKKQLTIINASVPNAGLSVQEVSELMSQVAGKTKVQVASDYPWLSKLVASGATSNGLVMTKNQGARLQASLVLEDITQKQGWFWQKGVIKLALSKSGVILSEKIWPIKISSTEKGGVAPRFQKEVSNNIHSYVYQVLTQSDQ